MHITVTGAKGFLGQHMVHYLASKKHTVTQVSGVDLTDYQNAYSSIPPCDLLFHFAADMGGVGYFSQHQYRPFVENMRIDLHVLDVAEKKNIKKIFYPSSACAYPTYMMTADQNHFLSEIMLDAPAFADQLYGWEKFLVTKLSVHAPMEVRVGILHTIFGEGQAWDGEKAKFPPSLVAKVIRHKKFDIPISLWGDGSQRRTFLYVHDAIEMMYEVATATRYEGPVNISSEEIVSVDQCTKWVCEHAKIKPEITYDTAKPSGALYRGVDMTKFNKFYTYRPKVDTQHGLSIMYDWMYDRVNRP